jgi:hypothetical protein
MSLGELLYDVSEEASAACWGLNSSRRVDTVWGTAGLSISGYRGAFPARNARGLEQNSGNNVELTVGNDRQFKGDV